MSMKAIVKSVISGDSLVLRGRPGVQGQPPKERVLHLADITAPRLGTATREDEPWAFESREFLRAMTVGKEVSFASIHSLPTNDDVPRDLGCADIAGVDLSTELLRNGWAKVKESKRELGEDDLKKKELENEAKAAGKGMWNPHGPQARSVQHSMPLDSHAFVTECKGKNINAIVETVRDGSTVRVRLLMPDGEHQMINIALAGVRCARCSSKPGEPSEPWAEEAKFFTESRLLQRHVRVQILSLPTATATPFQATANAAAAPAPATIYIGNVLHPAGNVAEHLVAAGLARVVDWHAGMLASGGGMERLRTSEKAAKEKRLCLYAHVVPAAATGKGERASAATGRSRVFDGTVVRVWNGDQVSVLDKETGRERRLQLSSVRGPKLADPKQAHYAHEAREFLRKKLIGKHVKVSVDFVRPREGEFEERECASVRFGGQNANIAEQLVEKGLASVVRHKRDDEDRSADFDKLMAAEQAALAEARGIHSGKDVAAPKTPLNISETNSRATQFLNGFKRMGRLPAVVDYVAAGSRFKLYLPKDNQTLTLALAGIRAPRGSRSSVEKGEAYGNEATEFSTHRYMQRDVEFEVESVDKSGGFIGTLYLNKSENAAVALVKEGLATVHAFSAEGLSWARQLFDAEAAAKREKKHVWTGYDEDAQKAAEVASEEAEAGPRKAVYLDVVVSDIHTRNGLGFSVQVMETEGIALLDTLMKDFAQHHQSPLARAPAGFAPRGGELVAARYSKDGLWYRAKVRRASAMKRQAEVTFIDYGNQETVEFGDTRPLEERFRGLAGQAREGRLSFVKLAGPETDYHAEAVERFKMFCEGGRRLVANVDYQEGAVGHMRLMDPQDPESAGDALACFNVGLVREGLGVLDRRGCGRYLGAYPAVVGRLREAVEEAKRERAGMFEFGDIEEDE